MDPGRAIRSAREAAGLTQAQLAVAAATSQAAVSAYEHGRKQPSVATLARLLAAAGSRLTTVPAHPGARMPSRAEHARVGHQIVEVLGLAEQLPVRHRPTLARARLPRAPRT